MKKNSNGQTSWLTFDLFADFRLVHGTFLKHEASDKRDAQLLALKALNVKNCCSLNQKHGNRVIEADLENHYDGDGLVTNKNELSLMILHADCQAALFYDPVQHALALTHCGWRGSIQNIYQETVVTMKQKYGSQPENIFVGISPSLGPEASEFIHFEKELPTAFWAFQKAPRYFDFWAISEWQLKECGILAHHIEIAKMCTYSYPDDFFSYRRDKLCGRHVTIASLK